MQIKSAAFYFSRTSIFPVARAISRRKHNKPEINASIAAMNSIEIVADGSMPVSEPTKSAAITMQTNRAQTVQRLIAQWIRRALRDSVSISVLCAACYSSLASVSFR